MICKKCKSEMELDSSEGIGYTEMHHYNCLECDYSITTGENGEVFESD